MHVDELRSDKSPEMEYGRSGRVTRRPIRSTDGNNGIAGGLSLEPFEGSSSESPPQVKNESLMEEKGKF